MKWHCQVCGVEIAPQDILYYKEVGEKKVWGIPMDVKVLRVCRRCHRKLEMEKKGLKECLYCKTVHKINERCPNCGAS